MRGGGEVGGREKEAGGRGGEGGGREDGGSERLFLLLGIQYMASLLKRVLRRTK